MDETKQQTTTQTLLKSNFFQISIYTDQKHMRKPEVIELIEWDGVGDSPCLKVEIEGLENGRD